MTDGEPASVARGFLFADLRGYSAWVEAHAKALREDRDMGALLDWWEDVGRFMAP